jgi:hypothetical protein
MNEQSIHEAEANYSERASEILQGWYTTLDEIVRSPESIEGPYVDHLTDEGRASAVREQKSERANAERERFVREYGELTEEHHEQVESRVRALSERLFKVEDAGALARVALATDTELGTLLELATQADNTELGRVVFVAAEQRGLGDLMAAYFDKIAPEARGLYEEYKAAPSKEIMERRLAGIETMFTPPASSRFAAVPTGRAY